MTKPPRAPLRIATAPQSPHRLPDLSDAGSTCPECDYDLTGAPGDRCPWCGWRIEVDELAAAAASRRSGMRLGVAATAALAGIASLVLLSAQLAHGPRLAWRDALAAVAVFMVAVGHLSLAWLSVRSRREWPMRGQEAATVLRVVGWLSIAASAVVATRAFSTAPEAAVNNVMGFAATACFLSLPGIMLLMLRLVSFRHPDEKYLSRFAGLRGRGGRGRLGATFDVEFEGRLAPDRLSQSWTDESRPTSPDIEEMILRSWQTKTTIAAQTGRTLYNSCLARLVQWQASRTGIHLLLGDTCYRDFLGTNLFNAKAVASIDSRFLADALGTSSIVITNDGFLVLGLRGERVAFHAGYLHTFGGMLEEADRRGAGYDVFGGARREVVEELGVGNGEIASVVLTGLVRDRTIRQPELLFDLALTLSRAELAARFHPGLSDGEHAAIEFVPDNADAIVRLLARSPRVASVAQAGLLLHGKHNWGAAWYAQTCHLLYGEAPRAMLQP